MDMVITASKRRNNHVDIKEGETKIINKKIGLSHGKPDIILIVNKGLFQDCEFDYSIK